MMNSVFLLNNVILISTCFIMSLIFLFIPLPKNDGLKEYRISLRFLAFSYMALSVLTIMDLLNDNAKVNFSIDLTAFSFQTILFSFTLINLFNKNFATTNSVLKHMFPTLIYIFLSYIFSKIWDFSSSQDLQSSQSPIVTINHPTSILNILFLVFCIGQMFYFVSRFSSESKKYKLSLNNYYAETYQLQLVWVHYFFYGAFIYGAIMAFSIFISSPVFDINVTGISILFYALFGLFYLQYPRTYINIEPVFNNDLSSANILETEMINHSFSWDKLKIMIIEEEYYLRQGVNIIEMAQFLKIGRTTLSNLINKEEKMNFYAWINNLRIEKAKQIFIENSDYTILQVAEMTGFSESSNFCRQFKQITNQSPSAWKQTLQKN